MQKSVQKAIIFGSLLSAVLLITIILIASNVMAARPSQVTVAQQTATAIAKNPTTPTAGVTPTPTNTPVPTATPTPKPTPTPTPIPPTPTPVPPPPAPVVTWNNPAITGYTTGWINVWSGPNTVSTLLESKAPNVQITLYGKADGENINGNALWYRISGPNDAPMYVYGGLVTTNKPAPPPQQGGSKVIVVNLSQQHLYAYENDKLVFDTVVSTGRPELATPAGTYTVYQKGHDMIFQSPWPKGSPYYYEPTPVKYGLLFREGGFYIHDSPWRYMYGPGSNVPHTTSAGTSETGTHGCVNLPMDNMAWLYNWAPVGTVVKITY